MVLHYWYFKLKLSNIFPIHWIMERTIPKYEIGGPEKSEVKDYIRKGKKNKKMKLLLISEGRGPKRKAAEEYLNASSIRNTTDTT